MEHLVGRRRASQARPSPGSLRSEATNKGRPVTRSYWATRNHLSVSKRERAEVVDEPTKTRAVDSAATTHKGEAPSPHRSTMRFTDRPLDSTTAGKADAVTPHDVDPDAPSASDPAAETHGERKKSSIDREHDADPPSGDRSTHPTPDLADPPADDRATRPPLVVGGDRARTDHDGGNRSRHRAGDLTRKTKMQFGAVVAALLLLPAAVAYVTAAALPDVHEARAEVLVTTPSGGTVTEQTMATQLTLLTSSSVIGPVAREANMDVSSLTDSVSVERVNDSQVLGLSVTADDADRAVDLTAAVVTSYLTIADATAGSSENIDFLRSRLQELTATLADLDTRLEASANAGLASQREILISQIGDLQMQLTTAEIGELQSAAPAEVITEPYALPEPISPRPARAAVGGFVGGAILAGLAVVLFVRRTRETSGT